MTVGAIIVFAIFTLCIVGFGGFLIYEFAQEGNPTGVVVTLIIAGAIIAGMWVGGSWYYKNTESGKRALKTQDSNFHGGIEREIIVYDMEGDEIERFRGKFDVDYGDERIMFDDENGNRHVIYFKSGTVIVNEIREES